MAVIWMTSGNTLYFVQSTLAGTQLYSPTYIDVLEANNYFAGRLNSDTWDETSPDDKLKALRMATERIDRLNIIGGKTDPNQLLLFPRNGSSQIPQAVKKATCEIALALLNGFDPDMEIENLDSVSQGYSTVRTTYDRTQISEHIVAGIPSPYAWSLLKPYLRDPRNVNFSRVT